MKPIAKLGVMSVLLQLLLGCAVLRTLEPAETTSLLSLHYKTDTPALGSYYIQAGNRSGRGFEFYEGNLVVIFPQEGPPRRRVISADTFLALMREWDEIALMEIDETNFDFRLKASLPYVEKFDADSLEYRAKALVVVDRRNPRARALVIAQPGYMGQAFAGRKEGYALTKVFEFEKKICALAEL
jgi:hypothetical protein